MKRIINHEADYDKNFLRYLVLCYVIDYVSSQGKQGGAMASLKSEIRKTNERIILAFTCKIGNRHQMQVRLSLLSIIIYSIISKFQLNKEFKY